MDNFDKSANLIKKAEKQTIDENYNKMIKFFQNASQKAPNSQWLLNCDLTQNTLDKIILMNAIENLSNSDFKHKINYFKLIKALINLLESSDYALVEYILDFLVHMLKKSNILIKLPRNIRNKLYSTLLYLAQNWYDVLLFNCCLDQPLSDYPSSCTSLHFEFAPSSAITTPDIKETTIQHSTLRDSNITIHVDNVNKLVGKDPIPSYVMHDFFKRFTIPDDRKMELFCQVRMAYVFPNLKDRICAVSVRLKALALLLKCKKYTNQLHSIITKDLIFDVCNLLNLPNENIYLRVKTSALQFLTMFLSNHQLFQSKIPMSFIVEATQIASYTGIIPKAIRDFLNNSAYMNSVNSYLSTSCQNNADLKNLFDNPEINNTANSDETMLAIAIKNYGLSLLSFVFHLTELGEDDEMFRNNGMIKDLLACASKFKSDPHLILYETRCVRILDNVAVADLQMFINQGGPHILLQRFQKEIEICIKEVPYIMAHNCPWSSYFTQQQNVAKNTANVTTPNTNKVSNVQNGNSNAIEIGPSTNILSHLVLYPSNSTTALNNDNHVVNPPTNNSSLVTDADVDINEAEEDNSLTPTNTNSNNQNNLRISKTFKPKNDHNACVLVAKFMETNKNTTPSSTPLHCQAHRAALLKSILNLLKNVISDLTSVNQFARLMMTDDFIACLKHIISNVDYYGTTLFLLALDLVSNYIFSEPSELITIQKTGLTDIMLHSLLDKGIPATRKVMTSLPTIFTSLCLNHRGMRAFVSRQPFDKLFRILITPKYLPALRATNTANSLTNPHHYARHHRNRDDANDLALNEPAREFGAMIDELLRHQPTLKLDAMSSICKIIQELIDMGELEALESSTLETRYYVNACRKLLSNHSTNPSTQNNDNVTDDIFQQSTATNTAPTHLTTTLTDSNFYIAANNNINTNTSNSNDINNTQSANSNINPNTNFGSTNLTNYHLSPMSDTQEPVSRRNSSTSDISTQNDVLMANDSDNSTSAPADTSTAIIDNQLQKDNRPLKPHTDSTDQNALKNDDFNSVKQRQRQFTEYMYNVLKFLESIISNGFSSEHCQAFISKGGPSLLMKLISLPILPYDFIHTKTYNAFVSVFKWIVTYSQYNTIMKMCIDEFDHSLTCLKLQDTLAIRKNILASESPNSKPISTNNIYIITPTKLHHLSHLTTLISLLKSLNKIPKMETKKSIVNYWCSNTFKHKFETEKQKANMNPVIGIGRMQLLKYNYINLLLISHSQKCRNTPFFSSNWNSKQPPTFTQIDNNNNQSTTKTNTPSPMIIKQRDEIKTFISLCRTFNDVFLAFIIGLVDVCNSPAFNNISIGNASNNGNTSSRSHTNMLFIDTTRSNNTTGGSVVTNLPRPIFTNTNLTSQQTNSLPLPRNSNNNNPIRLLTNTNATNGTSSNNNTQSLSTSENIIPLNGTTLNNTINNNNNSNNHNNNNNNQRSNNLGVNRNGPSGSINNLQNMSSIYPTTTALNNSNTMSNSMGNINPYLNHVMETLALCVTRDFQFIFERTSKLSSQTIDYAMTENIDSVITTENKCETNLQGNSPTRLFCCMRLDASKMEAIKPFVNHTLRIFCRMISSSHSFSVSSSLDHYKLSWALNNRYLSIKHCVQHNTLNYFFDLLGSMLTVALKDIQEGSNNIIKEHMEMDNHNGQHATTPTKNKKNNMEQDKMLNVLLECWVMLTNPNIILRLGSDIVDLPPLSSYITSQAVLNVEKLRLNHDLNQARYALYIAEHSFIIINTVFGENVAPHKTKNKLFQIISKCCLQILIYLMNIDKVIKNRLKIWKELQNYHLPTLLTTKPQTSTETTLSTSSAGNAAGSDPRVCRVRATPITDSSANVITSTHNSTNVTTTNVNNSTRNFIQNLTNTSNMGVANEDNNNIVVTTIDNTNNANNNSVGSVISDHTRRLESLLDMGFARSHALEALRHTTSLEQATEYLLNLSPTTSIPIEDTNPVSEPPASINDDANITTTISVPSTINSSEQQAPNVEMAIAQQSETTANIHQPIYNSTLSDHPYSSNNNEDPIIMSVDDVSTLNDIFQSLEQAEVAIQRATDLAQAISRTLNPNASTNTITSQVNNSSTTSSTTNPENQYNTANINANVTPNNPNNDTNIALSTDSTLIETRLLECLSQIDASYRDMGLLPSTVDTSTTTKQILDLYKDKTPNIDDIYSYEKVNPNEKIVPQDQIALKSTITIENYAFDKSLNQLFTTLLQWKSDAIPYIMLSLAHCWSHSSKCKINLEQIETLALLHLQLQRNIVAKEPIDTKRINNNDETLMNWILSQDSFMEEHIPLVIRFQYALSLLKHMYNSEFMTSKTVSTDFYDNNNNKSNTKFLYLPLDILFVKVCELLHNLLTTLPTLNANKKIQLPELILPTFIAGFSLIDNLCKAMRRLTYYEKYKLALNNWKMHQHERENNSEKNIDHDCTLFVWKIYDDKLGTWVRIEGPLKNYLTTHFFVHGLGNCDETKIIYDSVTYTVNTVSSRTSSNNRNSTTLGVTQRNNSCIDIWNFLQSNLPANFNINKNINLLGNNGNIHKHVSFNNIDNDTTEDNRKFKQICLDLADGFNDINDPIWFGPEDDHNGEPVEFIQMLYNLCSTFLDPKIVPNIINFLCDNLPTKDYSYYPPELMLSVLIIFVRVCRNKEFAHKALMEGTLANFFDYHDATLSFFSNENLIQFKKSRYLESLNIMKVVNKITAILYHTLVDHYAQDENIVIKFIEAIYNAVPGKMDNNNINNKEFNYLMRSLTPLVWKKGKQVYTKITNDLELNTFSKNDMPAITDNFPLFVRKKDLDSTKNVKVATSQKNEQNTFLIQFIDYFINKLAKNFLQFDPIVNTNSTDIKKIYQYYHSQIGLLQTLVELSISYENVNSHLLHFIFQNLKMDTKAPMNTERFSGCSYLSFLLCHLLPRDYYFVVYGKNSGGDSLKLHGLSSFNQASTMNNEIKSKERSHINGLISAFAHEMYLTLRAHILYLCVSSVFSNNNNDKSDDNDSINNMSEKIKSPLQHQTKTDKMLHHRDIILEFSVAIDATLHGKPTNMIPYNLNEVVCARLARDLFSMLMETSNLSSKINNALKSIHESMHNNLTGNSKNVSLRQIMPNVYSFFNEQTKNSTKFQKRCIYNLISMYIIKDYGCRIPIEQLSADGLKYMKKFTGMELLGHLASLTRLVRMDDPSFSHLVESSLHTMESYVKMLNSLPKQKPYAFLFKKNPAQTSTDQYNSTITPTNTPNGENDNFTDNLANNGATVGEMNQSEIDGLTNDYSHIDSENEQHNRTDLTTDDMEHDTFVDAHDDLEDEDDEDDEVDDEDEYMDDDDEDEDDQEEEEEGDHEDDDDNTLNDDGTTTATPATHGNNSAPRSNERTQDGRNRGVAHQRRNRRRNRTVLTSDEDNSVHNDEREQDFDDDEDDGDENDNDDDRYEMVIMMDDRNPNNNNNTDAMSNNEQYHDTITSSTNEVTNNEVTNGQNVPTTTLAVSESQNTSIPPTSNLPSTSTSTAEPRQDWIDSVLREAFQGVRTTMQNRQNGANHDNNISSFGRRRRTAFRVRDRNATVDNSEDAYNIDDLLDRADTLIDNSSRLRNSLASHALSDGNIHTFEMNLDLLHTLLDTDLGLSFFPSRRIGRYNAPSRGSRSGTSNTGTIPISGTSNSTAYQNSIISSVAMDNLDMLYNQSDIPSSDTNAQRLTWDDNVFHRIDQMLDDINSEFMADIPQRNVQGLDNSPNLQERTRRRGISLPPTGETTLSNDEENNQMDLPSVRISFALNESGNDVYPIFNGRNVGLPHSSSYYRDRVQERSNVDLSDTFDVRTVLGPLALPLMENESDNPINSYMAHNTHAILDNSNYISNNTNTNNYNHFSSSSSSSSSESGNSNILSSHHTSDSYTSSDGEMDNTVTVTTNASGATSNQSQGENSANNTTRRRRPPHRSHETIYYFNNNSHNNNAWMDDEYIDEEDEDEDENYQYNYIVSDYYNHPAPTSSANERPSTSSTLIEFGPVRPGILRNRDGRRASGRRTPPLPRSSNNNTTTEIIINMSAAAGADHPSGPLIISPRNNNTNANNGSSRIPGRTSRRNMSFRQHRHNPRGLANNVIGSVHPLSSGRRRELFASTYEDSYWDNTYNNNNNDRSRTNRSRIQESNLQNYYADYALRQIKNPIERHEYAQNRPDAIWCECINSFTNRLLGTGLNHQIMQSSLNMDVPINQNNTSVQPSEANERLQYQTIISSILTNEYIPSTLLYYWCQEITLLDGPYMHCYIASVKGAILHKLMSDYNERRTVYLAEKEAALKLALQQEKERKEKEAAAAAILAQKMKDENTNKETTLNKTAKNKRNKNKRKKTVNPNNIPISQNNITNATTSQSTSTSVNQQISAPDNDDNSSNSSSSSEMDNSEINNENLKRDNINNNMDNNENEQPTTSQNATTFLENQNDKDKKDNENNVPMDVDMPSTSNTTMPEEPNPFLLTQESTVPTFKIVIGDGLDPSFLSALPENLRQEVMGEQIRLRNVEINKEIDKINTNAHNANPPIVPPLIGPVQVDVCPTFLAGLPSSLQHEITTLQQQEQERQNVLGERRRVAALTVATTPVTQSGSTGSGTGVNINSTNPDFDPALFIHSLPYHLRQQVLLDLEESVIAVLPDDLAREARNLQRAQSRNRTFQQSLIGGYANGGHHHWYTSRSAARRGTSGQNNGSAGARRTAIGPNSTAAGGGNQQQTNIVQSQTAQHSTYSIIKNAQTVALAVQEKRVLDTFSLAQLLVFAFYRQCNLIDSTSISNPIITFNEPSKVTSAMNELLSTNIWSHLAVVLREACKYLPSFKWFLLALLDMMECPIFALPNAKVSDYQGHDFEITENTKIQALDSCPKYSHSPHKEKKSTHTSCKWLTLTPRTNVNTKSVRIFKRCHIAVQHQYYPQLKYANSIEQYVLNNLSPKSPLTSFEKCGRDVVPQHKSKATHTLPPLYFETVLIDKNYTNLVHQVCMDVLGLLLGSVVSAHLNHYSLRQVLVPDKDKETGVVNDEKDEEKAKDALKIKDSHVIIPNTVERVKTLSSLPLLYAPYYILHPITLDCKTNIISNFQNMDNNSNNNNTNSIHQKEKSLRKDSPNQHRPQKQHDYNIWDTFYRLDKGISVFSNIDSHHSPHNQHDVSTQGLGPQTLLDDVCRRALPFPTPVSPFMRVINNNTNINVGTDGKATTSQIDTDEIAIEWHLLNSIYRLIRIICRRIMPFTQTCDDNARKHKLIYRVRPTLMENEHLDKITRTLASLGEAIAQTTVGNLAIKINLPRVTNSPEKSTILNTEKKNSEISEDKSHSVNPNIETDNQGEQAATSISTKNTEPKLKQRLYIETVLGRYFARPIQNWDQYKNYGDVHYHTQFVDLQLFQRGLVDMLMALIKPQTQSNISNNTDNIKIYEITNSSLENINKALISLANIRLKLGTNFPIESDINIQNKVQSNFVPLDMWIGPHVIEPLVKVLLHCGKYLQTEITTFESNLKQYLMPDMDKPVLPETVNVTPTHSTPTESRPRTTSFTTEEVSAKTANISINFFKYLKTLTATIILPHQNIFLNLLKTLQTIYKHGRSVLNLDQKEDIKNQFLGENESPTNPIRFFEKSLSIYLSDLDGLWDALSSCLDMLETLCNSHLANLTAIHTNLKQKNSKIASMLNNTPGESINDILDAFIENSDLLIEDELLTTNANDGENNATDQNLEIPSTSVNEGANQTGPENAGTNTNEETNSSNEEETLDGLNAQTTAHSRHDDWTLILRPSVEALFRIFTGSYPLDALTRQRSTLPRSYASVLREPPSSNTRVTNIPDTTESTTTQENQDSNLLELGHLAMDDSSNSVTAGIDHVSMEDKGTPERESDNDTLKSDTKKFLSFASNHRQILNRILRQAIHETHSLGADGSRTARSLITSAGGRNNRAGGPLNTSWLSEPFTILATAPYSHLLDFDVKRKYFRDALAASANGGRGTHHRNDDLPVHVRRSQVFEDSYRDLHRQPPSEWKCRFYIVFEGEEGQDAGGLLREWYSIIAREIFNPNYALFRISPGDRVTYTINPASHCNSNHLSYFKFVGRVIAKALFDNKHLECYFTRSFYKHILGKPVNYTDMESEDYDFYQGLVYLLENDIQTLGYDLTFSTQIQEFGVTETRDLKPNGRNILVTEDNKKEYVSLLCQMKMTGAIKQQLNSFLDGFYDIIPKSLISIFNEQELELFISGLPKFNIEDLKTNTEYHKYQSDSPQVVWFWRALKSFDAATKAKFLQFVTGTSKVPLQGFASLEGMNGVQKFQIYRDNRSTDRLPSAHTCFNQLDLPAYETYEKLRAMLLKAILECTEGFGLA